MTLALAIAALTVTSPEAIAAPKAKGGGKQKGGGPTIPSLNTVAPVQPAGSDAGSTTFKSDTLNDIRALAAQDWAGLDALGANAVILDPSKIALVTDYDVRAYFVGEDTKYRNSIGFNTEAGGVDTGNPLLMFPDAVNSLGGYSVVDAGNPGERTADTPLIPGDFVEMGNIQGGTDLNFFLIADGAKNPKAVYSSETALNPQQNPYMMAFAYTDGDSSYLVFGFEDGVGKGKDDFTDVVIALDIGDINIGALTASPEPATVLTLGSLIGLVGYARHRSRRREEEAAPDDQS
jgi:hypothetical protein